MKNVGKPLKEKCNRVQVKNQSLCKVIFYRNLEMFIDVLTKTKNDLKPPETTQKVPETT